MLRTFIDTSNVGDRRWRSPLVDADWHPFSQAVLQGVEGPEWEAMCHHHKGLHQAVQSKKSGENRKAKVLWAMKEVKDRVLDYQDTNHKKRNSDETPIQVELVGYSPTKPNGRLGESVGMSGTRRECTSCNER